MLHIYPSADNGGASVSKPTSRSRRFYVRLCSDVIGDPRLSDGAVRLYCLLLDHAFGKAECWPGEVHLAQILQRDTRTIRTYLQELADAGHVTIRKVGRRNHYVLRSLAPSHDHDGPDNCGSIAPKGEAEADARQPEDGDGQRKSISGVEGRYRKPASGEYRKSASAQLLQVELRQGSSAAAAERTAEQEQAADALKQAGVPHGQAKDCARRDAALARAAAAWLPLRLANIGRKPVENLPAFVAGLFKNPARYGFEQDAEGVWRPPPEIGTKMAKDAARHAAEREQRRREREEFKDGPAIAAFLASQRRGERR